MTKEVEILPTTVDHIRLLVANLRDDDLREIEKWNVSPFKGIWRSYRSSKVCKSGFINGKIVAIWGINGSVLGFFGNPWLITSNVADDYPFVFAMIYRREVREMLKSYRVLETWCDAAYTKSLTLMRIMGFKEVDFVPGHNGFVVRLRMDAA